jgi:AraC-like DNA-binding protein
VARYEEAAPPQALQPWAQCIWRLAADREYSQRVVPDGCMDIVWTDAAGLITVGANTTAFMAPIRARSTAVGVRLRPGGAPPLFGVSADELRDAQVPAGEIWGAEGARLTEAVEAAGEAGSRIALLLHWLLLRARAAPRPEPLVTAVADRLQRTPELRVGALPRELAVSERHLRRLVVSHVGYGPKRLGRVLRLQRALAEARSGRGLAETAALAGYADQAHFANECRALAGTTPTALVAR